MSAPLGRNPLVAGRLRGRKLLRGPLGIPREARHSLGWDTLAGFCAGAYMGMVFPFLTRILRNDLDAPDATLIVLNAAPFLGNLLAPVWARQMEGRAKMPFVLGSWIPARLLLFLAPLAVAAWPFTLLISSIQLVGTISSPAYASLMKDIYPDRARGKLMGYVRMVALSAMFLATFFTGRLLDHTLSYREIFPVAGLFGVGAALCFARVRPLADNPIPVSHSDVSASRFVGQTLSILRDNVGYRWFAISVMTYGFGNLMAGPLYAIYQIDRFHMSFGAIANLTNISSLCSIAGMFFWGRFLDRVGASRTVFYSILLVISIGVVYLVAPSANWLYLAAALSGFGFAGIELSYMASILGYAQPGKAAQYQALHSLLLGIRGIVAPFLALPLARHFGFTTAFVVTLVLMVVGAITQWRALRVERTGK